ncbi:serine/threonine protein kinase [bacterium]|nr:serine/threonine protein kinase [bacterium]
MDLSSILQAIAAAVSVVKGSVSVAGVVTKHLRDWARTQRTAKVLAFVRQLGLLNDADVRAAVKNWDAPKGITDEDRRELAALLTNLVRGARFHSTQGTPLSSYLRCERLIEQLLQNLQPKRRAGERVGSWELKSFLGMGAFGEVWRAENPLFPDPRVFKFFTLEGARDWLRREAEVLFAVRRKLADCPNVIEYADVEIDAQPHPYLALEYADGGSLEDWILNTAADERPPFDLAELVRGVVRGVAAAHRHGIYHRDLKPANVLLSGSPEPVPKVADFGLSRVDTRADGQSSVVSAAVLVGTRMYHPPEASDPIAHRDPAQDDVFALGVIWYQVLTGNIERPPYDFVDRLTTAGVDSRTVRMVSRCLAHPDRRYPSACELYDDLDVDAPPGPGEWSVPKGCFDVAGVAREYLERTMG